MQTPANRCNIKYIKICATRNYYRILLCGAHVEQPNRTYIVTIRYTRINNNIHFATHNLAVPCFPFAMYLYKHMCVFFLFNDYGTTLANNIAYINALSHKIHTNIMCNGSTKWRLLYNKPQHTIEPPEFTRKLCKVVNIWWHLEYAQLKQIIDLRLVRFAYNIMFIR